MPHPRLWKPWPQTHVLRTEHAHAVTSQRSLKQSAPDAAPPSVDTAPRLRKGQPQPNMPTPQLLGERCNKPRATSQASRQWLGRFHQHRFVVFLFHVPLHVLGQTVEGIAVVPPWCPSRCASPCAWLLFFFPQICSLVFGLLQAADLFHVILHAAASQQCLGVHVGHEN